MSRRPAAMVAALLVSGCAGAPMRPASPAPLDEAAIRSPAPGASAAPDAAEALGRPPEAAPGNGAAAHQRRSAPRPELPGPPDGPGDAGAEDAAALRERVVEAARRLLGKRPRLDCSGYVLAAFAAAGVAVELEPARSRSESLYRASRPVTRPSPGDLVFFHDTHDRDRNGRRGDRFTHVALVEALDGTALTLLHRGGRRVERIRMDLSRPADPAANDPVRVRRRRDPRGTRYLSGELFAAFGGLLGEDVAPKLQARRGRDTSAREPARR